MSEVFTEDELKTLTNDELKGVVGRIIFHKLNDMWENIDFLDTFEFDLGLAAKILEYYFTTV